MTDDFRIKVARQLCLERDELLLERVKVREQWAVLITRDRTIEQRLVDIAAAGRVFGTNLAVPIAADCDNLEKLTAAMTKLRGGDPWIPRDSYIAEKNTVAPSKTDESVEATPTQAVEKDKLRIRDLALDFLKNAGTDGAFAANIRQSLKARNIDTHQKTVGMTLYRLSREGSVRRDGRKWFFVPPSAETKNPGASTPGSDRSTKVETKGG